MVAAMALQTVEEKVAIKVETSAMVMDSMWAAGLRKWKVPSTGKIWVAAMVLIEAVWMGDM